MKQLLTLVVVSVLALAAGACKRTSSDQQSRIQEPTITITALEQLRSPWKVVTSDQVSITVSAPGARMVRILDRPEGADEQIELARLTAPSDPAAGKFIAELKVPSDFAGELWAEVTYSDGTMKETEQIPLTTATAIGVDAGEFPPHRTGGSVGTDESARSDKMTGGRIEQARLTAGDPNIRITINVPAFQMTLWQSGKEVKTYDIGIGRKNFPLVIGEREATAIIFNPRWIPPDSRWVRRTNGVEPYERIEPDDPRNPLGKIKIPLGDGYLIHEAAKPSDIGNLVSHGCVRMLADDLFDLAQKIIAARGLEVSPEQIRNARTNAERLVVKLRAPLLVDINYDPQVVEGGVLHLYPDVYERGAFSVESLRAELQSSGVDTTRLEEQTLKEMMARVNGKEQFAIRVADIKAGRFEAGETHPLVARLVAQNKSMRRKR
jgi:lipoprotein-anchoring transpeptidase ErfK/SrfK